jgi:acyl-CoA thioesterase I
MLSGLGVLLMPGSIANGRNPPGSRPYNHAAGLFNAAIVRRIARFCSLALAGALLASPPAAAAAPRILALGDSLTAGYGLPADQAFPVRLQARLNDDGYTVQVVNAGVSGDTSAGGLARLDWALADKPDLVLVEFGANDALRGIDPKVTFDNLDKMLARIVQSGARPLLVGMRAPSNWGREYQQAFDAIFPTLAEKYRIPLYPFFLDGVAMEAALNQADGLHPNPQGVAVIVERISPYVERLLGRAASTAGSPG